MRLILVCFHAVFTEPFKYFFQHYFYFFFSNFILTFSNNVGATIISSITCNIYCINKQEYITQKYIKKIAPETESWGTGPYLISLDSETSWIVDIYYLVPTYLAVHES